MVMDYLNFTPSPNPKRLSQQDLQSLLKTFRTNLALYFEQRTQKNQIRVLIESMQSFAEDVKSSSGVNDSPSELLKDILMHLI
jgi:hypothetical protein